MGVSYSIALQQLRCPRDFCRTFFFRELRESTLIFSEFAAIRADSRRKNGCGIKPRYESE
jgi:hypothetical protein